MNKKDVVENVKYIAFGIIAAYVLNFGLGLVFGTDLPIVAVVSGSMTHDSFTNARHYQYLEENLGYSREQVDSWPINGGFLKGDVLLVKGVTQDELKTGDVIVYDINGQSIPIVHRIVKVDGESIATKGDHNSEIDPWKLANIRGKTVFVIPFLGWPKVTFTCALYSGFSFDRFMGCMK